MSRAPASKFRVAAEGAGLPPKVALIGAVGAIVLACGVVLFTGDRLNALGRSASMALINQTGRAGFQLTSLKVSGASAQAVPDIAAAAGLQAGEPLLVINLKQVQDQVMAVGWVKDASVMRLWPNTLAIVVKERQPAAIWQTNGAMRVIDADGAVISEASPGRYPQLPLLVGIGANAPNSEVMQQIRARPRLLSRMEALVRVDDRRWDIRLKDGGIIQLPATFEDKALAELDRMDRDQRLLDLGFERIDLRTPGALVVRPRSQAKAVARSGPEGV